MSAPALDREWRLPREALLFVFAGRAVDAAAAARGGTTPDTLGAVTVAVFAGGTVDATAPVGG